LTATTDEKKPPLSFVSELKNRNVFKVMISYGLVAWLVAQLAEFAVSTFGAPDWVLRTFVVLLILGLPIAVILAWAFDMTPAGLIKASAGAAAGTGRSGTNYVVVILMGVVLAAAVVLQFWGPEVPASRSTRVAGPSPETRSLRADIVFPEDTPLAFIGAAALGNGRRAFAISPDGAYLVFVGLREGQYDLYLRDLDSYAVRKLGGTDNAYDPFFSPNGQWIAFFSGNQLKRVARAGGDAVTVTEATNSAGGTWTGNDRILASTDEGGHMLQFTFGGERLETEAPGDGAAPHALPDGKRALLAADQIIVYDTASKQVLPLAVNGSNPRFMGGFLFYSQGNTLIAARFDPESLTLQSTPVPVLTGLRTEIYGFSQWSLSNDGTLVYAPGISAAENPLAWVDGEQQEDLPLPQKLKGSFEISPDGKQLLLAEDLPDSTNIWLYDLEGGQARKLIGGKDIAPSILSWMADGKRIVYHRYTEAGRIPYVMSVDSGDPGTPLFGQGDNKFTVWSISADGRFAGARKLSLQTAPDDDEASAEHIAVIDLLENREIEIPLAGKGNWGIAVSPGGGAVVYTSPVSGEYQNYLQPVPPTGVRYQLSRAGGAEEPRWSRDGSKIYYRSGQRIMVVDVQTSPEIVLSEPRVFYQGNFVNVGGRSYDISPDGKRALVIRSPVDTARSVRVITNWLQEVGRIVSASESP
jgi:Tol biopolymer transport system component